jgi:hypothetical protein
LTSSAAKTGEMDNTNKMDIKVLVNFITLHLSLPINRYLSCEITTGPGYLSNYRDSIPLSGLAGIC